jgi:hypothetical protein
MAGSAWTNQLINLLIIAAQSDFSGVFVYNPTPGTGNLIASVASAAGTDVPYGNPYEEGIAAYENISGITYAVQMGQASFAGIPVAGLFVHVISGITPAFSDPSFSGTGTAVGSSAILYSGQSTSGSTGSGIQATDSTGSGVTSGTVNVVAGQLQLEGTTFYDGLTMTVAENLVVGNGVTSTCTFSPPMATPPNAAQVAAGTATLAQLMAFCNGMYQSMKNRGMFN